MAQPVEGTAENVGDPYGSDSAPLRINRADPPAAPGTPDRLWSKGVSRVRRGEYTRPGNDGASSLEGSGSPVLPQLPDTDDLAVIPKLVASPRRTFNDERTLR